MSRAFVRRQALHRVVLAGFVFAGGGCASILSGSKEKLTFESDPPGATVSVAGAELGKTPLSVEVKRGDKQPLMVQLAGYKTYKTDLPTKTNILTFLNIIFGSFGFFSCTTDANTGAIRTYAQDKYMITLVPENAPVLRIPESKDRELKQFVIVGYSNIQTDVARGSGDYLNSLYGMLEIPKEARKEALEKIRALSTLYKEIPTFADKLAEQFLLNKPEQQKIAAPVEPKAAAPELPKSTEAAHP